MAQRRSRNRRLSSRRSSNQSGFLNDNTNIVENDDELWFNRTSIRPSTSVVISKYASPILDTNSTVDTSRMSEKWYNNLTRSDSSKLMESVAQKNYRQNNVKDNSIPSDTYTESESDQEFRKKRARLKFSQKNQNKSDKSNIFSKVLEKTTDSYAKNATAQVQEENESESTNDDSKTIQRLRPRIFKTNNYTEQSSNKFDDVLNDNSILEKTQNRTNNTFLTKSNSNDKQFSTPESSQKLIHDSLSNEKSLNDKTVTDSNEDTTVNKSSSNFNNRSILSRQTRSSAKLSQNRSNNESNQQVMDEFINVNVNTPTKKIKKRQMLFSQKDKSASSTNLFDAVLESENDDSNENIEKKSLTEKNSEINSNNDDNDDESENSTIPINIRRTRSLSVFAVRQSESETNGSNYNKKKESQNDKTNETKILHEKSKNIDKSSGNYKNKSSQQSLAESSDDEIFELKVSSQIQNSKSDENEKFQSQLYEQKSRSVNSTLKDYTADNFSDSRKTGVRSMRNSRSISNNTENDNTSSKINKNQSNLLRKSSPSHQNVIAQISTYSIKNNSGVLEKNKSNESFTENISAESSDEEIYDVLSNRSTNFENDEIEKSQMHSSIQVSNLSVSALKNISLNISKSGTQNNVHSIHSLTQSLDNTNKTNSTSSSGVHKIKSRLMMRYSSSQQNIFDQISENESSKGDKRSNIENTNEHSRTLKKNNFSETNKQSITSITERSDKSTRNRSQNSVSANDVDIENIEYEINSPQEETDADTSSLPKHIRRTISRSFQKSKIAENSKDAPNEIKDSNQTSQFQNKDEQQTTNSVSLRDSMLRDIANRSPNKFKDALMKEPQVLLRRISTRAIHLSNVSSKENNANEIENNQSQKLNIVGSISGKLNTTSKKKNSTTTSNSSGSIQKIKKSSVKSYSNNVIEESQSKSSVETSSDRTPEIKTVEKKRTASPASSYNSDVLSTPHPAQSTLNLYGKPLTRVTQFSFRDSIVPPETSPITAPMAILSPVQRWENDDNSEENDEVDVVNDSGDSNDAQQPLPERTENILSTTGKKGQNKTAQIFRKPPSTLSSDDSLKKCDDLPTASSIDAAKWVEIRKKTDALKMLMEAQEKRKEARKRELAQQKARIDAKFKRQLAQRAAEKKRQQKIATTDKAYFVNGQLYKQPKLPRPKPWVTQRLYKHLWKCMQPKFSLETRIRSEKFILKLSDAYSVIVRRKKYENYKSELDDLLVSMAKLNVIKDRYDFYRFCSEFMPSDFNMKVVPMMLPGNKRNIPFDPELVHKPILNKKGIQKKSSDNDSEF